jgi:uncharacterized membrane protein YbhN (UPF0104 family)
MGRPRRAPVPWPLRLTLWAIGISVSMALGAFLLALALREVPRSQVVDAWGRASVPYLVGGFGAFLGASLARGVRWWVLLGVRGVSVGLPRLLLVENTALGVNNALPIPILDEAVRVGLLAPRGIPAGAVLATMATQRTFELGGQALLVGVGVVLLPPLRPLTPYVWGGILGAAVATLALFLIGPRLGTIPLLGRLPLARDFGRTVAMLRRVPLRVGAAFLLTLAYALGIGVSGGLVAKAFALSTPLLGTLFLTLITLFTSRWIPGLPASIGPFEFIAVTLLGLWGVERPVALGFALVLHFLLFLPPTVVAAVYLPLAGYRSLRAVGDLLRPRPRLSLPG